MEPQHQTLKLSKYTDPQHHYRVLLYGIAALLLITITTGAGYLFANKNISQAANQTSSIISTIAQRMPTPTAVHSRSIFSTPSPTYPPLPVSVNISPDGSYVATWLKVGNKTTIAIYTKDGHVISYDILQANYKTLGYGVKFKCTCSTRVKEWIDNTHFTVVITNESKEEYQYLVNAKNGLVDESSLTRIQ